MALRLEMFAFRFRDPRTGGWIKARHRCEMRELKARYPEFEIVGPPEIRDVDPEARYFTPHRREARSSVGNLGPVIEITGWKPGRRVAIAGVAT